MKGALRELLTGLIDYAGMFPPANLSLELALANHLRYSSEPEAWMLGRFICPAARASELPEGTSLRISALGSSDGTSTQAFVNALESDLGQITACRQKHEGRIVVDVLETRVPREALQHLADLESLLEVTMDLVAPLGLRLFLEPPSPDPDHLALLLDALKSWPLADRPGCKVRTAGQETSAVLSIQMLADALVGCRSGQIPFKATAGLHHPLPRLDPATGTWMHGFVNLFVAGVLAATHPADPVPIREILAEEDPSPFHFTDDGLSWREVSASIADIAQARRTGVLSFGSCSFDEPRNDLRDLGWL